VPNAREQYLQAMASVTEVTRSRAERLAARLAKQGELQSTQVGRFAEQLMRRTQRNRETLSRLIQREVKRQLGALGIATRDEVARLQQRVRALEQAVERPPARSTSRSRGAAAEPAGRAPATRSTGGRRGTSRASTGTSRASTGSGGGSTRGSRAGDRDATSSGTTSRSRSTRTRREPGKSE
jgi:polyhydroxyalkanoate synthesis regulator phasin